MQSSLSDKIRNWGAANLPFTWYFTLFAAVGLLCYWTLRPLAKTSIVFPLLVKIGVAAFVVLLLAALIPVLVAWIYLKKQRKKNFQWSVVVKDGVEDNYLRFQLSLAPVMQPLMGFLRFRLLFDDGSSTEKFSLVREKSKQKKRPAFDGYYDWEQPDVKPYHVAEMVIYMEDFLQFFSFPMTVDVDTRFTGKLHVIRDYDIAVRQNQQRDEDKMTLSKTRTQGEYLNHKSFEESDDVRRILWKVYAKNRELVVRVPEIVHNNASEVCIYASFHTSFPVGEIDIFEKQALNFYKNAIWTAYAKLSENKDLHVSLVMDLPVRTLADTEKSIQENISHGQWQNVKPLPELIAAVSPSLILVSSLNALAEVEAAVARHPMATFLLVPLSESFGKRNSWLQWIFVQGDEWQDAGWKWKFSIWRGKILNNEAAIEKIITRHNKVVQSY